MEQEVHALLLSNYYETIDDYDKITQLTSQLIELAKIHYKDNNWGNGQ
jgi:hypothetical protein